MAYWHFIAGAILLLETHCQNVLTKNQVTARRHRIGHLRTPFRTCKRQSNQIRPLIIQDCFLVHKHAVWQPPSNARWMTITRRSRKRQRPGAVNRKPTPSGSHHRVCELGAGGLPVFFDSWFLTRICAGKLRREHYKCLFYSVIRYLKFPSNP